jgi:hypothetical protein
MWDYLIKIKIGAALSQVKTWGMGPGSVTIFAETSSHDCDFN